LGFLTRNWYCYQAVVKDLFHNAEGPGRVGLGHWVKSHLVGSGRGSKILTGFHIWLTAQAEGFPWNDKIFCGCQRMGKVPNAVEILPKITTAWVGCTSVTDRQTTDAKSIMHPILWYRIVSYRIVVLKYSLPSSIFFTTMRVSDNWS